MAVGTGIANGFTGIVISGLSAFGGVTLAFAVMERRKIRFEMKKEKNWTVRDLGRQLYRKAEDLDARKPVSDSP